MNRIIQRRPLSGFKKLPKKPIEVTSYTQLTAPDYQLGFKKPESGILEVETGRIIAGKKEVKVIESDEAFRSRIKDTHRLGLVKTYLPMLPIVLVMGILYVYILLFDASSDPPAAFQAQYIKRKNNED